jgi:hypothetical protein
MRLALADVPGIRLILAGLKPAVGLLDARSLLRRVDDEACASSAADGCRAALMLPDSGKSRLPTGTVPGDGPPAGFDVNPAEA